MNMRQRKTADEIEEMPRKLAPLRTIHRRGGPMLRPVGHYPRTLKPLDEASWRRQPEAVFGKLWRGRPPVALNLFAAGEEHRL
jgi:hypothetical protein